MMLPQMGFAFIFKCFPSGNTKVSFMVIVDSFLGRDYSVKHGVIFNDDININNRFR